EGTVIVLRNLENAVKQGSGQLLLLRRIDLDIDRGDFVTVMGPSGAGKSTLLAILGLLDAGWTGEYELMGDRVDTLSAKARGELGKKTIGFVFQQYHLLDGLTVAENLEVPLSYRGLSSKERQALVADALDRFRMVGKKDLYPTQRCASCSGARDSSSSPPPRRPACSPPCKSPTSTRC